MSDRLRYSLAALAAGLWIASFFLPAVETGQGWHIGWQIAVAGWAGPLAMQFGWYANLLIIPALGMLALGEPRGDFDSIAKLGLALFLLWANTLFWADIPLDNGRHEILARGAGYYAWMAAMLIAWLGLFVLGRLGRADERQRKSGGDGEDALEREGGAM